MEEKKLFIIINDERTITKMYLTQEQALLLKALNENRLLSEYTSFISIDEIKEHEVQKQGL